MVFSWDWSFALSRRVQQSDGKQDGKERGMTGRKKKTKKL